MSPAHWAPGAAYLIFRVAIPAAMPSIFIGLFMGLGASFLTLVVAETVGVKSGLGWYVSLGARLGGIWQGLRRAGHHGRVLLDDHDGALQSARPRAGLAKGSHQMVTAPATCDAEGVLAAASRCDKSFPRPTAIRTTGGWP